MVGGVLRGRERVGIGRDHGGVLGERRDDVVALADPGEQDRRSTTLRGLVRRLPSAVALPCRSRGRAATISTVRARIERSSASERCSTYQRSSSIRSRPRQRGAAVDLGPAGDPGPDGQAAALTRGVLQDLALERRAAARRSPCRRGPRSTGWAARRASSAAAARPTRVIRSSPSAIARPAPVNSAPLTIVRSL